MRLLHVTPVLPSADIGRDVRWYTEQLGFRCTQRDDLYAVLRRDELWLHLQWHAGTPDDPLLGGSVIKIFVEDVASYHTELRQRGAVAAGTLRLGTDWGTNEFGLYDPNGNAVFFVEDA